MIQFNLLPDVKIEYLKAKRQKHIVMLVSSLTIVVSIVVIIILATTVFGLQRKNISDLTTDIQMATSELQNTPDLDKILTVQNQLNVLPQLHDEKPVASRIFGYINQATPNNVSIGRLNVNFESETMRISGSADSLETINQFVDTLKFTEYTADDDETSHQAFSSVVLTNFGRDVANASYTIELSFDSTIFSQLEQIELKVPNIVTTRSGAAQPEVLFEEE
jgi:Tfp pilus assembly protein PilN